MTTETDYLIVGSGAVGLAFADSLIDHSDADIIIADRHSKPGGHWNDAHSSAALHQPSAVDSVDSMPPGTNRKDELRVNIGVRSARLRPGTQSIFRGGDAPTPAGERARSLFSDGRLSGQWSLSVSAVRHRDAGERQAWPIFEGSLITPQLVRAP